MLLVFQGFIVSAYNSLPAVTPKARRDWFRTITDATMAVLLLSFATTMIALNWLVNQTGYDLAVVGFGATVLAVAAIGVLVSRKLVR